MSLKIYITRALESCFPQEQVATQITQETILKVAEAVAAVKREGVDQVRERIVVLRRQLNEMVGELERLETDMSRHGSYLLKANTLYTSFQ